MIILKLFVRQPIGHTFSFDHILSKTYKVVRIGQKGLHT